MNKSKFFLTAGVGCLAVILLAAVVALPLFFIPVQVRRIVQEENSPTPIVIPSIGATQEAIPTLTPLPVQVEIPSTPPLYDFTRLYDQLNPGVVNIRVYIEQGGLSGEGAGSGFVLDDEGHIVTNNHVVADAARVTVIFYDGTEAEAEIVGVDDDSDLAVIRVGELPENVHPLPIGDSERVEVGEWVIAIGNPFGLGSSMTLGIVSAIGRSIPSGATPFAIPQAIQTDAAINPGNSGGPLLDLEGYVVGVNAQIASSGAQANAGVGFAIPSDVVRRVAPVLIEAGSYEWPWLGIEGGSVNLLLMEANGLDTQQGAYVDSVVRGSPAEEAGLQPSSGFDMVDGQRVPVGGDVIVASDEEPIIDFSDLLVRIAFKTPGDTMDLTVIRDGSRRRITVKLAPRPSSFGS
jgi:2-alkenal reductase